MTEHSSAPTSLYRYYDEFGTLIYVGITGRGTQRNVEHARKAVWWPYVASQTVEHLPSRQDALDLEAHLIATLHPPFNKQHNGAHHAGDAYIRVMTGVPRGETFDQQYARVGKKLPLLALDPDVTDGLVTFSTASDCWMVASRLDFRPPIKVHGRHGGGKVKAIRLAGPYALVDVTFPVSPGRVQSAYARLAAPMVKGERTVWLRGIALTMVPDSELANSEEAS